MKILFLDQSGNLGGAELCLLDIAQLYRDSCLVGLFASGTFKNALEQQKIPVQVLGDQGIQVRKDSNLLQGLKSLGQLIPLIFEVAQLSRQYDLIYVNTQKALVVGSLASLLSHRPLVYHLHDILSKEHFSPINLHLKLFTTALSLNVTNIMAPVLFSSDNNLDLKIILLWVTLAVYRLGKDNIFSWKH
jgi:hypothetical protein